MRKAVAILLGGAAAFAGWGASGAFAQAPRSWEIGFQPAASPIMERIESFHNMLLIIITLIVLFVVGLMIWAMIRYNEGRNPVPSRTSHNATIEVLWTVVPVLILVMIAIPSFRLLYAQNSFPKADLTIKAIGHQWYWSYEYPDQGNLTFDSYLVEDSDLKPGQPRLLTVDNEVVVPVHKVVYILTTGSDVIHSWTIPAFGVKMDAIPGRVNSTWFVAEKTGVYHGQCSELCGSRHAYMPITVRVVSEEDYKKWIEAAKKKFASAAPASPAQPSTETRLASADDHNIAAAAAAAH
jgi:cytochrome c oxidase subunit 2